MDIFPMGLILTYKNIQVGNFVIFSPKRYKKSPPFSIPGSTATLYYFATTNIEEKHFLLEYNACMLNFVWIIIQQPQIVST